MIAANAVTVSVTARADHFEIVITQFRPGRHRKRAAMQGVHPVGIDESGQVRGTSNSAHDKDLVWLESQLEKRCLQRGENGKIPATRTPIRVNFSLVAVPGQLT